MSSGTAARSGRRGPQSGFTFVEFAVVVAILMVVASFAVPRFRDAVERTRAGEAVQFLNDVWVAQERYQAALGRYADDLSLLELTAPMPGNFAVGTVDIRRKSGIAVAWSLTLTRDAESSAYGPYTVTFSERGYDARRSTLSMLPEISPIEDADLFLP